MNMLLPAEPALMHALITFEEAAEDLSAPPPRLTPLARGVSAVADYAQMQLLLRVLKSLNITGDAASDFILKVLKEEVPLQKEALTAALNAQLSL